MRAGLHVCGIMKRLFARKNLNVLRGGSMRLCWGGDLLLSAGNKSLTVQNVLG